VWEVLDGWAEPLTATGSMSELPAAARAYVEFIGRELEVPIELVGVGAARDSVLV
jgi:adenylosuccinate synthase